MHSQQAYEAERDKIFRKRWINIAREWEVPEPGSYIYQEYSCARPLQSSSRAGLMASSGVSIISVPTGATSYLIRINGPARAVSVPIMCAFHGWTYDLEGKCLKISDEGKF